MLFCLVVIRLTRERRTNQQINFPIDLSVNDTHGVVMDMISLSEPIPGRIR